MTHPFGALHPDPAHAAGCMSVAPYGTKVDQPGVRITLSSIESVYSRAASAGGARPNPFRRGRLPGADAKASHAGAEPLSRLRVGDTSAGGLPSQIQVSSHMRWRQSPIGMVWPV